MSQVGTVKRKAGRNPSGRRSIALIGSAGIPNRYGGFESFAEHVSPVLVGLGCEVVVTCDAALYRGEAHARYGNVERRFLRIRANGVLSPLHDLAAYLATAWRVDCVLVLGVSGGVFFPIFRLLSAWFGAARLVVNIDGVEWRRTKFGALRRLFLYVSDRLAQRFAHGVIYDNEALLDYVSARVRTLVPYSGDHVLAAAGTEQPGSWDVADSYALTVCRIEPENNCELLMEGFLRSRLGRYIFVGNWDASAYGRALRQHYAGEPRLSLIDPVYDPEKLHKLRKRCAIYLHGHSVGGTNPSLVEMLFYNHPIACFDCSFNRHTAVDAVEYFSDSGGLANLLNGNFKVNVGARVLLRERYSAVAIGQSVMDFLESIRRHEKL